MVDIVGAAIGSFCLAWLIYEVLTPLSGGLGFFASWYGLFLATVWFLARERVGKVQARDRLVGVIVVATVGIGILDPARGHRRVHDLARVPRAPARSSSPRT